MGIEVKKEKIAFVCQRYGIEVNGGAELYCRQIAEKLSKEYDVTVYTTCAIDYLSWANHYPAGESFLNGVKVKRFPVVMRRFLKIFGVFNRVLALRKKHFEWEEKMWVSLQGPMCPTLLGSLKAEQDQYHAIFFMTYLYYTTVMGILNCPEKAILIPTVHDEAPVYLKIYDKVFGLAKGIVWNTEEERTFAFTRFPFIQSTPSVLSGIGIDCNSSDPHVLLPNHLEKEMYLLYVGRIDENKGCNEMLQFFRQYKNSHRESSLKLVLIGKSVIDIPETDDIIHLGYVSDQIKYLAMQHALGLVLHSRYESLSMVVLESMALGRPVIVTAQSAVLKGHCDKSGAGFAFDDYSSYEIAVDQLCKDPILCQKIGQNGIAYINENYRWHVVLDKYKKMIHLIDGMTE